MKHSRASRTAHLVALGRAMAHAGASHVRDFHDPTARVFLSDKGRRSLDKTLAAIQSGKRGPSIGFAHAMGNMMALRTTAIDNAVRAAMKNGATQLVILGAGYDGRAWRMPELANIRVFEVDHPATQDIKRSHVPELPDPPAQITFVPVDFERDSLERALADAGHDADAPTCWIWEGVVMYLTRDAMHATLASIAARSARASTLIVNYHSAHRRWLGKLMLRLIGEPQISAWTPDEMAADLRSVGFEVVEHSGMLDWNARYAGNQADVARAPYMRIAVASVARRS